MPDLIFDERGVFDTETFYSFAVPFRDVDESKLPPGSIVGYPAGYVPDSKRTYGDPLSYWFELVGGYNLDDKFAVVQTYECDCPVDQTHHTRSWDDTEEYECDLFGGPLVQPLTYLDDLIVVTENLKTQIESSSLKGAAFVPIKINVDQTSRCVQEFLVLRGMGKPCFRSNTIVGRPNACPWCGCEPLICPACHVALSPCPRCLKECFGRPLQPEDAINDLPDRRLKMRKEDFLRWLDHPILDGIRWDGSDFSQQHPILFIITRRAVDWLLSVHAGPFIAKPVRVDVTGMTDEQLKQLATARQPISAT